MEESLQVAHAAIKELSKRVAEKPSIRDEYAMVALNGLLANNVSVSLAVVRAGEAADLMMEARK